MASSKSLTGGTGDVNPQFLSLELTLSAANTLTNQSVVLPISKFQQKGNKAVVIEILKVFWNSPLVDANNAAGGNNITQTAHLSTALLGTAAPNSPFVFAYFDKQDRGAFTAAGTYQTTHDDPVVYDCSDGAGHGILVATDRIFFQAVTTGHAAAVTFGAKIMYRFKEINLPEYIGIVQGQQGPSV